MPCKFTYFYKKNIIPIVLLDNHCQSSCNLGFLNISGICIACQSTCAECLGLPSFCTKCNSPHFLHENACVSIITPNFYEVRISIKNLFPVSF